MFSLGNTQTNLLIDIGDELKVCSKYLPTVEYRTEISPCSLVIGRYSVLPYYVELERELKLHNSVLINIYDQHQYIADFEYYHDVVDFTPKTYFQWNDLPDGSYVVKGKTNSRKFLWNTHMFAKTKEDVPRVAQRLFDDQFIDSQGLIVREYVPLKQFDVGINDMPITNEWRFFFLGKKVLVYDYYWSNFPELMENDKVKPTTDMVDLAKNIAEIVSEKVNFFVLDIAEKESGGYTLIEINDGQMSGLSMCDPAVLYRNLSYEIHKWIVEDGRAKG